MNVKNADGHLGPVCNNCGGYGYTLTLTKAGGGSLGCSACDQTGIAQPSKKELQDQIDELKQKMKGLK